MARYTKKANSLLFLRTLALVASIVCVSPLVAQASLYAPGATLNPDCAPTDSPLTCGITSSSSSGIASSTANSIPYYAANGSTLSATTSMSLFSSGNISIGTTTSGARVTIQAGDPVSTGAELISNGTFDAGTTGWNLYDTGAYNTSTHDVTVNYTGVENNAHVSTSVALIEGKLYAVTFTLSSVSNDTVYFYFNNAVYTSSNFSAGTHTVYFNCDYTSTDTIFFENSNWNNNSSWTIDNVSVREAVQQPGLKVIGRNGATLLSFGEDLLDNAAIGNSSLYSNTSGHDNVASGMQALYSNTTGYENVAAGSGALYLNTIGQDNTANGYSALNHNDNGNYNTANGAYTLLANTSGSNNTATGLSALRSNITGDYNTGTGMSALYGNTTGHYNTGTGAGALYGNTTGLYNVGLGYNAGKYYGSGSSINTTPGSSVFLGYDTRAAANGETNQIVIGTSAIGNGSNSVTLGNTSIVKTILRGNVGIGTTSPAYKLDVAGFINTDQYSGYNIDGRLFAYASSTNAATILGIGAGGQSATTSATNRELTAVGYNALNKNTTGVFNTAIGYRALRVNTTGMYNTANGGYALDSNITGDNNTATGYSALSANTSGSNNVANGLFSMVANTTGYDNAAVGAYSLYNNTTGYYNTAIGMSALRDSTTSYYNSAVGAYSLKNNVTGSRNVALGYQAGYGYATAVNDVVASSTFIGYQAGYSVASSTGNIFIGNQAGYSWTGNQTGTATNGNNIVIGNNTDLPSTTSVSTLDIGNLIYATGLTNFAVPSSALSAGNVGISTTSPFANFSIHANNGSTNTTLFAIASSTASATTTLFSVSNRGDVTINGSSGSTCTLGDGTGGTSCTSDERLKTNVALIVDPLNGIEQLRGVTFNWADQTKDQSQFIGVIAQDVQKVFPQAVSTTASGYLSVDYGALVAPLIGAVQELAGRVGDMAQSITTEVMNATTVHTDTLCVGSTCITESQLKDLLQKNSLSGQTSASPIIITDVPADPAGTESGGTDSTTSPNVTDVSTPEESEAGASSGAGESDSSETTAPDSSGTDASADSTSN